MSDTGHSEAFFNDYRDHWWNRDFVALMAARLDWTSRRRVLDVGAGLGHWTRTILPHLLPQAQVIAVDTDPKWLEQAASWVEPLRAAGHDVGMQHGDAQTLPFPDGSFDMVTCQTVLIHVRDPLQSIREMMRVLAPGGLLFCVEPDNAGVLFTRTTFTDEQSLEDVVNAFEFSLAAERGRRSRGQGDYLLGGLVPGLFQQAGLRQIQTWLSDKPHPLYPPYELPEQQAVVNGIKAWPTAMAPHKESVRELFLAGGGDPARFDANWDKTLADAARMGEATDAGRFANGGAVLTYLVSGVKP
jgi:SAM-dependent methyltransferase